MINQYRAEYIQKILTQKNEGYLKDMQNISNSKKNLILVGEVLWRRL